MKLLKIAALFAAALLSSGCAQPEWRRVDGRPVDESFDWAVRECRGRATERDYAVEAMKRCMYRRGYVWSG
jgi:hypothetical protein